MLGGTGLVDFESDQPGTLSIVDGQLYAGGPGAATVTFEDRYTGQTGSALVRTAASITPDLPRTGERRDRFVVAWAGDLNGDGHHDAIVGAEEADYTGFDAGAVMVYRGTEDSLAPAPVQIFGGGERRDRMGQAVVVADVVDDRSRI